MGRPVALLSVVGLIGLATPALAARGPAREATTAVTEGVQLDQADLSLRMLDRVSRSGRATPEPDESEVPRPRMPVLPVEAAHTPSAAPTPAPSPVPVAAATPAAPPAAPTPTPSAKPTRTPTPTPATTAAPASAGISAAPCAGGSAVESGLTADAIRVHRAVCALFPSVSAYGGLSGSGGEHSVGRALDIMIPSSALGDRIAAYVRANATALGVSEVIWSQRIWTVQRSGEGWRPMPDRGSATANHFDHVHVTVYGSSGG